jgi:hypothetical protein
LLADGRWLAVERGAFPGEPAAAYERGAFSAILRRFNANGTLDRTFPAIEVMRANSVIQGTYSYFTGPRTISARDSLGRIYLGIQHGDSTSSLASSSGASRLFRLRAEGTLDPTFSPLDLGPLYLLVATSEGLIARTELRRSGRYPQPSTADTEIVRLKLDGSRDSGFQARSLTTSVASSSIGKTSGLSHDFDVLTASPEGAILARANGHFGHLGFIRLTPDGRLDANFNAELGTDTRSITQIHSLGNGQLLVAGTFPSLLGVVQPYLARLTPNSRAATTYLANISVRARAGTKESTLIAGYTTQGGETSVLARGAGPALAAFGVATPLADPQLALFFGSAQISANDNWGQGPAAFLAASAARLGAFPFPEGSLDAALYTTSAVSSFTVHVAGKDTTTGIALAELFLANPAPVDAASPRAVNFSVRTRAGSGDDTLIVGFTLVGPNTRNLLIRAVGPGLARFGVTDTLPDPVLTLFRGSRSVAINDDWTANSLDIDSWAIESWLTLREAFSTVGAFPLEFTAANRVLTASKDAALLISLAPGSYTLQVSGKAGSSGVALVEVYEIP